MKIYFVLTLNDNTILGNAAKGDVLVSDVLDGTGSARDGLDADTVLAVDDLVVVNVDILDGVVGAAADGTDRQTVSTRAVGVDEADASARVNGEAVVLVVDSL